MGNRNRIVHLNIISTSENVII